MEKERRVDFYVGWQQEVVDKVQTFIFCYIFKRNANAISLNTVVDVCLRSLASAAVTKLCF